MKNLAVFFALFSVLYFVSCKPKTETYPFNEAKNYFPIVVGKYIAYQVDSIYFDNLTMTSDTFSWQERRLIDTAWIDAAGDSASRIIISIRDNDSMPWSNVKQWYCNYDANTVQVVEENLRYIKLSSPVKKDVEWMGNQFINATGSLEYLNGWNYKLTSVDQTESFKGLSFDLVSTVTQLDEENAIAKSYCVEKFQRGLGMIYKEQQFLTCNSLCNDWTHPESGTIVKKYILSHN